MDNSPPKPEPSVYLLPDTLRNWPYQRAQNANFVAAENDSLEWLTSLRSLPPAGIKAFRKPAMGLLCGLTFPKASYYDLRSCIDMMVAFWIIDDHTDSYNAEKARAHCDIAMDAIRNPDKPRPEGEPLVGELCRQFWKRASANAPQVTIDRFAKAWRGFLDSVVIQAERRQKGRYICTTDEYIASRRDNIGSRPCFALMELSLGVHIPRHILDHPTIMAIEDDTCDMITLLNDMCSYWKETVDESADYNAVTVVMHNNHTDVAGALQWISADHDKVSERFLRLRNEVFTKTNFPSYGEEMDRQVEAYVDGLGNWVRGHDEWTFGCSRYFGDKGLEIQRTRKVFLP